MLAQYTLKMPRRVHSSRGAPDHAEEIMGECATKVTVFSDQGIVGAGLPERPLSLIKKAGVEHSVLDELPTGPDYNQAQAVINRFEAEKLDLIVAVDGGSVMDIAKLISVFTIDIYAVRDLLDNPRLADKCVPTLMIPITAGTDSEITLNSVMAVPGEELEIRVINDVMITDYVIPDEEMIRHLPRKIATTTGVDALAHGAECYISNKASPLSDTFALEAPDLTSDHIERTCDDPDTLDAKNAMLITTFYAGIAITTLGATTVRVLSYPLGGKYHIPHGVSNTMLPTLVVKFNGPACRERLVAVYDRVARGGQESGLPSEKKPAWIIRHLDEIVRHLEIPNSLKERGIGDEDLDILVEVGIDVKRLLINSIQEATAGDARKLCLEATR